MPDLVITSAANPRLKALLALRRRRTREETRTTVVEGYEGHQDLSAMSRTSPEDWATKIVGAIESDKGVLDPGGSERLAKLASRGPGFLLDLVARSFSRR